jgi:hypothetical protein
MTQETTEIEVLETPRQRKIRKLREKARNSNNQIHSCRASNRDE